MTAKGKTLSNVRAATGGFTRITILNQKGDFMKKQIYKVVLLHDPQHPKEWPIVAGVSRGKYFIDPHGLPERVFSMLSMIKENSEVYRIKASIKFLTQRIKEKDGDFGEIMIAGGRRATNKGKRLTLEVHYLKPPPLIDDLPKLELGGGDGAHRGLADWYPHVEKVIADALKSGNNFTTGWYASKHEIASARLSRIDKELIIETSVSDDFDTNGYDKVIIPFTQDQDKISDAIYLAWGGADKDRLEHHPVTMWAIRKDNSWIETYLQQRIINFWDDFESDGPPGDYYHQWGFQEGSEIPADTRKQIEELILEGDQDSFTVGEYHIEKVHPKEGD